MRSPKKKTTHDDVIFKTGGPGAIPPLPGVQPLSESWTLGGGVRMAMTLCKGKHQFFVLGSPPEDRILLVATTPSLAAFSSEAIPLERVL